MLSIILSDFHHHAPRSSDEIGQMATAVEDFNPKAFISYKGIVRLGLQQVLR